MAAGMVGMENNLLVVSKFACVQEKLSDLDIVVCTAHVLGSAQISKPITIAVTFL